MASQAASVVTVAVAAKRGKQKREKMAKASQHTRLALNVRSRKGLQMQTLDVVLLTAAGVIVVVTVGAMIRNTQVYNYRLRLLDTINQAGPLDWHWRLKVYDSVSYSQMLCQFWRPLDSFYPDKAFIDLSNIRGFAPWDNVKREGSAS